MAFFFFFRLTLVELNMTEFKVWYPLGYYTDSFQMLSVQQKINWRQRFSMLHLGNKMLPVYLGQLKYKQHTTVKITLSHFPQPPVNTFFALCVVLCTGERTEDPRRNQRKNKDAEISSILRNSPRQVPLKFELITTIARFHYDQGVLA